MRHRRYQQAAAVLKGDKRAIKKMVNARREQQPVLPIQPLLIIGVALGLQVACPQVFRPINTRHATIFLPLLHILPEPALPAARHDHLGFLSFLDAWVSGDLFSYMFFPFNDPHSVLRDEISGPFHAHQIAHFRANKIGQHLHQVLGQFGEINTMKIGSMMMDFHD